MARPQCHHFLRAGSVARLSHTTIIRTQWEPQTSSVAGKVVSQRHIHNGGATVFDTPMHVTTALHQNSALLLG
jgi:hypothetical protein